MNQEKKTASLAETRRALRVINGIGDTYADILFEAGLYQPADLLPYTPQTLVDMVYERTQKMLPLNRIINEDWLGQARNPAQQAGNNVWQSKAEFTLFFETEEREGEQSWQVRVYHNEAKTAEQPPFNISQPDTWVNWIIEQAKLPVQMPRVAVLAKAVNATNPPTLHDGHVEIQQVEVVEVAKTAVLPEKQLLASVQFRVTSGEAIKHRTAYRVDVHVVDVETNHAHRVATDKGQLDPAYTVYQKKLAFALPQVGRYELHTIVLLLPPYEMMTFYQGPRMKIVL